MLNGSLHLGHLALFVYAAFTGSVAMQLSRNGERTFDDVFTESDRSLVGASVLYMALPLVLLLSLAVQSTILMAGYEASWSEARAWLLHSRLPNGIHTLSPWQIVLLSLSGPVTTSAIGLGAIASTLYRPRNAAWNFARLELGRIVLGITWVVLPTIALMLGAGSLPTLRHTLNALPAGSGHTGDLAVLLTLAIAVLAVRFSAGPRFQRWYVELATPLFHAIAVTRARVAKDPNDAQALRDLGGVYLAAGRFDLAEAPLVRSADLAGNDPRTLFLLGMAQLKLDDAAAAERSLCKAGALLEQTELSATERRSLELEVVIALASARLRRDDAKSALETAEAALQIARRDPRALVVYSDALVAVGRSDEALAPLSLALEDARGLVEGEIRRRLAALERGR